MMSSGGGEVARRSNTPSAAVELPPIDDIITPEDPEDWEVVATSDDSVLCYSYAVDLDREETLLAIQASRVADLDYPAIAKRAILDAARAALASAPAQDDSRAVPESAGHS
jgi:hypothetical protein